MEMPYTIEYEDMINYAHILKTKPCDVCHGHSARVKIQIQSETLDKSDMIVNFYDLKKILKRFDHITLISEEHKVGWSGKLNDGVIVKIKGKKYEFPISDVLFLAQEPTVEYLSELIYNEVKNLNKEFKVRVQVWETSKGSCVYGDELL